MFILEGTCVFTCPETLRAASERFQTKKSKWCNPFSVKKYGLDECLRLYREYILSNKKLLYELEELRGKTLGCWCKPDKCHEDVLIELLNKK
jgi:hypothetical protein